MKRLIHYSSYLLVGGLTTLINLVAYKAFLVLGLDYRIAVTIAVGLSVAFAFAANRRLVFDSHGDVRREMALFFAARGVVYVINVLGLVALVEWFRMDEFWSQVLMNGLIVVLNYLFSRFLVFERVRLDRKRDDNHGTTD